jgi:hypothetical protein
VAGEREEGYTGGDQRDESTVSHFLILLPGVFSLGYLIVKQTANAAKASESAASGIGGRVEELAGKAAGCEGMEKEGLERQEKAN